uniref:Uncharacterized protein n=2 Tax=Avena sativa TaxID=4498 RepID=A0ACD5Z8N7_AVESA
MSLQGIYACTIREAARLIFYGYISNSSKARYYQRGQNIYFDGWHGLGASAVLVAIAELAGSRQERGFDIVIHVDCLVWESKREMQRSIAEELKLDITAMELLDEKDEADDFSGVDKSDRAELDEVGQLIYNVTKGRKMLVIFHNGSDDEIDLARFGLPVFDSGNIVLWTFRGRFRLDPMIQFRVRYAHYDLLAFPSDGTNSDWKFNLAHEEASQVRNDISPDIIIDCFFYWCLLYFDHEGLIDYDEDAHASNCWVCDGIIPPGDSAWQIGQRLHEAMRLEFVPPKQHSPEMFSWFPFEQLQEKKSVWILVTSMDVKNKNIEVVPEEATSYFVTLEKYDHLTTLPKNLFHKSSKLRVLRLSCCTFSFASPPFTVCRSLKFISVDSCTNEDAELIGGTHKEKVNEWEFLKSLWVLDIRDTNSDWILSPSKMRLMTELRELNIKAAGNISCVQNIPKLEFKLLCNLRKLRVIGTSTFFTTLVRDAFMGMQKLELLDLSGNSDMEFLPNILAASRLRVLILDGCTGLQQVEPDTLPKSLESFSFDGFGRASRWRNSMHMPEKKVRPSGHANKEPPRVSKISLQGCGGLKNIFLRGLPNLKELNLSDTAIKELDLEDLQVVQIECLFLMGCRNLCRLKWTVGGYPHVKLLCIDFRGKEESGPIDDCCQYYSCSEVQQEASQQMVHIVITDAKFLRAFSIGGLDNYIPGITGSNQHFHIHLASSGGQRTDIGNKEERVNTPSTTRYPYMDVLNKVIKKDANSEACTQHLPLGCHIEIAKGGRNWLSGEQMNRIEHLMAKAESFHMHDHPYVTTGGLETNMYTHHFPNIRWCCFHRCPKLHTIFPVDNMPMKVTSFEKMQTLCVSHLLAVQSVWSRKLRFSRNFPGPLCAFQKLHHIHLHSCPRLKFVLPWSFHSLASLETIHIRYCGELRQIFPKWEDYNGEFVSTRIEFPSLKHVYLHELPMLEHICEIDMLAPALDTIFLRGCWNLIKLPAISSGRSLDNPLAVVDCEKDWWDNLNWDGLEASRPLFSPRHSCYYKKVQPRVSVLRYILEFLLVEHIS